MTFPRFVVCYWVVQWLAGIAFSYGFLRQPGPSLILASFVTALGLLLSKGCQPLVDRWYRRELPLPHLIARFVLLSLAASVIWFSASYGLVRSAGWDAEPLTWVHAYCVGVPCMAFGMLAWIGAYLIPAYIAERTRLQVEVVQSERSALEAQLRCLQFQINPHFLFNSLSSVKDAVRQSPDQGVEMVDELAGFFRSTLHPTRDALVPLERELALARHYLSIEAYRFGERLRVSWDVAPDLPETDVPPLLLQPLLENAIKHGDWETSDGLEILVKLARTPVGCRVSVSHPGSLADPGSARRERPGVGLRNVRERLKFSFGGRARFSLSDENGWVLATLEVPSSDEPTQSSAHHEERRPLESSTRR